MSRQPRSPDLELETPISADPPVTEKPPMFSPEEVEKIKADAKAKVEKELRAVEMKRLLAEFEAEERAALGLAPEKGALPVAEEELQHITISLPLFCVDGINLDGKRYFHGHSYRVSPAVYATLVDQMQMSWNHEDQKDGKFVNFNRRERDTHLKGGAMINAPIALNTRTMAH